MQPDKRISQHYTRGDLLPAILAGIEKLGKTTETVTLDDLAPVDEFHIGGRLASREFLQQLSISTQDDVLDLGCGIGGTSRFIAAEFGCRVSGVDLTREYVETGATLCDWLGLSSKVNLTEGSVLELGFSDACFDKAIMMHVGMNIPDKLKLCSEAFRVLRPGGLFGIYDIMKTAEGEITFPVPWASAAQGSWLATAEEYKKDLLQAGFNVIAERNREDFALQFFTEMMARIDAAGAPPPLGLHLIMGENAPTKIKNMVSNIAAGRVAPVELIAQKL